MDTKEKAGLKITPVKPVQIEDLENRKGTYIAGGSHVGAFVHGPAKRAPSLKQDKLGKGVVAGAPRR